MPPKEVYVRYFAMLREERGCPEETVQTSARTPAELYEELRCLHGFSMGQENLQVAVGDEFRGWDTPVANHDTVAFIPPVAGG